MVNLLNSLIGSGLVLILLIFFILINKWIFSRIKSKKESFQVTRQTISILLILVGTLTFILSLPIDKNLKGQILSFLAIIISAAIALSSTTVLGNIIAGIMNNAMDRFKIGDLIQVENLTGRVTRKNIFHTEIQLEDSNLVTIPNLFISSNPVKLTRKSNTVISTTVSLGYDISKVKIEDCLKKAALSTGLKDPYVYITELGDFSVSYKIHGFLEDSGKYFSTNSLLNSNVIGSLHDNNIEIVSPSFMNQRKVDEILFIPKKEIEKSLDKPEKTPEELIFDKAIEAGAIEKKKEYLAEIDQKIELIKDQIKDLSDKEEKEKQEKIIERYNIIKEKIANNIDEQNESLDKPK
ncbi:MAG: mechanosensitive ion channel [Bacteroidales bacterium]|jgi:small conductance mechanosensitive channel|nr:mechanosensitive ion channel [Bacteroidales bacterium]